MPKKAFKRKKAFQLSCKKRALDGQVNTHDGSWTRDLRGWPGGTSTMQEMYFNGNRGGNR